MIGDTLPHAAGGLPAQAPERAKAQPEYPRVGETPPPRPTPTMSEEERKQTEAELIAARERQNARARKPE